MRYNGAVFWFAFYHCSYARLLVLYVELICEQHLSRTLVSLLASKYCMVRYLRHGMNVGATGRMSLHYVTRGLSFSAP